MANKMLIDATHPEETRVVVLRGNRVEEFDFESAQRRQLRGNIYLAKVTRVEPSLQAAFIDYGGNRHGFLAFSEIHPDYYQIPVADRQALLDEEQRAHKAADDEDDRRARRKRSRSASSSDKTIKSAAIEDEHEASDGETIESAERENESHNADESGETSLPAFDNAREAAGGSAEQASSELPASSADAVPADEDGHESDASEPSRTMTTSDSNSDENGSETGDIGGAVEEVETEEAEDVVESVGGGDALEEVPERMPRSRRQYKIQEVIKRRQIMLVQVVKEERGTKGAALTTYLSLAGRYSVLMPNTARGGGISRKITNAQDRKRLKEVAQELEVPEGMGVILRTAGANRTKTEIKRDFEYLLRLWETVRDLTLQSTAPKLVYEEGSLIKRSIRDLYNKDIDEVLAAGDDAYKEAKDFMRMLMPSHAKNVKPYKEPQPIFTRFGIESQLDAMFSPVVQLRSGGYIVLNQTEALVSIDVNSGRATREHHIEDTALKTNLEAAEEIARQLRLRDLAGLVVIDFIDMDEKRNNRAVERRMKECLRHDRARIQVGRISHFGLLEMSRQRIRSSVLESSTDKCPHCGGTGHVRSVASVALQLVRALEEMLLKGATHNLIVRTRSDVALYVLNHKRAHLRELEERFRVTISIHADGSIAGSNPFTIERGEQVHSIEAAKALVIQPMSVTPVEEDEDEDEDLVEAEADAEAEENGAADARSDAEPSEDGEGNGRRRRRRRRRRRGEDESPAEPREPRVVAISSDAGAEPNHGDEDHPSASTEEAGTPPQNGERRRRRRGRRGGRRGHGERESQEREIQLHNRMPEHPENGARFEPELTSAVSDFDVAPPQTLREAVHAQSAETPAASAEAPAPAREEQPAIPEPPKRRSTVREPAPFVRSSESAESAMAAPVPAPGAPPPQPSVQQPSVPGPSVQDETDDTQPRKSGWWSRRLFGDKG